jgi:DnaB-like helicase N terminal domain
MSPESLVEQAARIRDAVPSSDGKRYAFRCAACGKRTFAEEKVEGEITTHCGCRFEDARGEGAATAATTAAAGESASASQNGAAPTISPRAAIAPPAAPGPYQTAPLHVSSPPSDDILRRVPPHDIEAEQAVLGAILIHNPAIKEILGTVGADDFYREAHRELYRCMLSLAQDDIPIDPVTLKRHPDPARQV